MIAEIKRFGKQAVGEEHSRQTRRFDPGAVDWLHDETEILRRVHLNLQAGITGQRRKNVSVVFN